MPRELTQLLVDEGVVGSDGVERALARQREAGGALDTALLELGLVGEERLAALLARASDLPAAPLSAYEAVDARARRVFPSKVAERHGLAPFALDGRELSLVATHPLDLGLLDEISFMLSLHLTPHVGPEWRVRLLIQRLYGGVLPARLARLAESSGGPVKLRAPSVTPHPRPAAAAPTPGPVEPDAASPAAAPLRSPPTRPAGFTGFGRGGEQPLEPLAAALAQAAEAFELDWEAEALAAPLPSTLRAPPAEVDRAPAAAPGLAPAPTPPPGLAPPQTPSEPAARRLDGPPAPGWSLAAARSALDEASTRDEVVQVALRYGRDFFQYVALFAVTRDAVAGHDALGLEEGAREVVRTVALYATDPGILRTTLDTLAPFLGPVTREATGNAAVLDGLGRETPRTALVYPILLRGRPICILYADNGAAPVAARRLGDLLLILSMVGGALERIIRTRKEGGHPVAPRRAGEAAPPTPALEPAPTPEGTPVSTEATPVSPEATPVSTETTPVSTETTPARTEPPEPAAVAPTPTAAVGSRSEEALAPPAPAPDVPPADPEPAGSVTPPPGPPPLDLSAVEEAFFSSAPGQLPAELVAPPPPPVAEAVAAVAQAPAPPASAPAEEARAQAAPSTERPPEPPRQAEEIRLEEAPASTPAETEAPAPTPTPTQDAAPLEPASAPAPASAAEAEAEPPEITLERPLRPPPPEVPTDPSALVGAYLVSPRGSDERSVLLSALVGRALEVAPILCEQLPGPLDVEEAALAATPAPDQGPVFAAVAALGPAALQPLLSQLAEPLAPRRRAAAALLGQLGDPSSFLPLLERCFDPDPAVAEAARLALAPHRRDPAMKPVPEKLRRALLSGLADKAAAAARALAALRDAESIPLLIQALEGSDGATAEAAGRALGAITLQHHGVKAREWLMWWKQNRGRSRTDWLFGALTAGDRELRLLAATELREAAATPVTYSADLPEPDRVAAAQAWQRWFTKAGHRL